MCQPKGLISTTKKDRYISLVDVSINKNYYLKYSDSKQTDSFDIS